MTVAMQESLLFRAARPLTVGGPLIGNLGLALLLDRARALLATPKRLRAMNRISGVLLIAAGFAIAVS